MILCHVFVTLFCEIIFCRRGILNFFVLSSMRINHASLAAHKLGEINGAYRFNS